MNSNLVRKPAIALLLVAAFLMISCANASRMVEVQHKRRKKKNLCDDLTHCGPHLTCSVCCSSYNGQNFACSFCCK
ncbi:unnamed protein product [Linum trigynum]|uniref:Uncharacterized protein n=1 Tax=Linum trigynum TaxID=586398 RepID=A0AAV2G4N4_9ROSI